MRSSVQALLDQNKALSDQMEEIKARLASLTHEIQSMQGRPAAGASGARPAPATGGGTTANAGASGDPAFSAAYADYTKGNYELALIGFTDYLKAHTDSPLASNAQD